jgi:quercetin dioxygenase-like cupin family protein
MRRTVPALVAGLFAFGAVVAYGQAPAKASDLKWGPAPAAFPSGAQMAVVSGDPGKAGPFTIQLSMPDGYKIKPHSHPTDENVTVMKGTFLVGMGDTWDVAKTKPLAAGASGAVPANAAHFAQAKGKTVVQVESTGPFAMTYVHPSDDPRGASH